MSPRTEPPPTVDSALQISVIIWVAMLMTQGLFVLITRFSPANAARETDPMVVWILLGIAATIVTASYVIKNRLMTQAVAAQNLQGVLSARIVALAICEVAGIVGMMAHFMFASPYYLLFFILAAVGILGHFPRRSEFEAATAPKPIL